MYLQHFGLKHEPLDSLAKTSILHPQFDDFNRHMTRLLQTKGIGILTGEAGVGKTHALRHVLQALNPHQYLMLYQAENHFRPFDIYCQLAEALGIDKQHRYSLLWREIKQHLLHLAEDKKITPIWILDEAQLLHHTFFTQLPTFLNFAFDTQQPLIILLVGLPKLAITLSKTAYEALTSRVQFYFQYHPLEDFNAFSDFINQALTMAGTHATLLSNSAMSLIHLASEGRLRYAKRILSLSLQIAAEKNLNHLPDEIVQEAVDKLKTRN